MTEIQFNIKMLSGLSDVKKGYTLFLDNKIQRLFLVVSKISDWLCVVGLGYIFIETEKCLLTHLSPSFFNSSDQLL